MIKYYSIENSLNEKLMGKIPQIKEFIHHCDIDSDPNSIDKFIFDKIEIQPILSNIVLYANAKQTDFINTYGHVGFGFGNLISDKLKLILEDFNCYGFQFFKTYILQNNKKNDNYWQTNIYDFPYQFIDFKNTIVSLKDGITRKVVSEPSNINNLEDFQSLIHSLEFPISISLSNLSFNVNMDLDFFTLRFFENGGSNGIVSERLKNELEKNEITGIEFRPIELPLQEWYHSGEREKIYGKV
jgi:hypothetical protein